MAWGYWSATSVDRGRSPRRHTHCNVMPINTVPQSEPPAPTCYSPCRSSRCSSPSCHASQVKLCHLFRSYTLISVLWLANRQFFSAAALAFETVYGEFKFSIRSPDLPDDDDQSNNCRIAGGRNGKQNGSARDVYQYTRTMSIQRQGIIRLT